MALFVAKLLDTHNKPSDELTEPSSPPLGYKKKESFRSKLARVLRRSNTNVRPIEVSTQFKAQLGSLVSCERRTDVHRWSKEEVEIFSSIPIPQEVLSDPARVLETSVGYLTDLIETQKEAREQEAQRIAKLEAQLKQTLVNVYKQCPGLLKRLRSVEEIVSSIDTIIKPELMNLKKLKFLESLITCVGITDHLHLIDVDSVVSDSLAANLYIDQLAIVTVTKEGLIGRSKDIIEIRTKILTQRMVDALTSKLSDCLTSETVHLYNMLRRFEHRDTRKCLSIVLSKKMEKFRYHFVRTGSALNVTDKPEWPLRWLLDLAVETAKILPSQDTEDVARYVAREARTFYKEQRWMSIVNPRESADVFSLYLARYLQAVDQWTEVLGSPATEELVKDLANNTCIGTQGWRLFDEWIYHDRTHIEKAIDSTRNPFKPSPFNPAICSLIQTIEDIFDTSRSRLQCISTHPDLTAEFICECHDQILDDVLYRCKVGVRNDVGREDICVIKNSADHLASFLGENRLSSPHMRKQFAEFTKLI